MVKKLINYLNDKKDRQCTYEARSCKYCCSGKAISITYFVCVCGLSYPAFNSHAPYCYLWPATLYFSTLSQKLHEFRKKKKLLNITYVLISSTTFGWNISHSKKSWARHEQNCIVVFVYGNRYSTPILIELEFSWQFFEKYLNIQFHENPSSVSQVVPCGRFSQFCDRA